MKYKPRVFPLTQAAAQMGNDFWTLLAVAGAFTLEIKSAQKGNPPIYGCGKPECTGAFALISKTERPLVCPKCGSEIDWTGIATKKVKRCPTCGKMGGQLDSYCKFHVPSVALKEVDEPI